MDLVVNAPLKAGMKWYRCNDLYIYLADYKREALAALAAKLPLPVFAPPPTTLAGGISAFLDTVDSRLSSSRFQAGLSRCFIGVGLARVPDDQLGEGTFRTYTGPASVASLKANFAPADYDYSEEKIMLSDITNDIVVEAAEDTDTDGVEDVDLDQDEESSGSDSEGDEVGGGRGGAAY